MDNENPINLGADRLAHQRDALIGAGLHHAGAARRV
jgi:hypothetical protein